MARAEIEVPDELIRQMNRLEKDMDAIISGTLKEGAEVAEEQMRENLRSKVSQEHRDGELVQALGTTKVQKNRNGELNIKVGFAENRSDGGINAKIANVLEHGGRGGRQPARPWLKPIRKRLETDAVNKMKAYYEKEVRK